MTQLSAHFALEEFQKDDAIPEECIPIFKRLCEEILEPAWEILEPAWAGVDGGLIKDELVKRQPGIPAHPVEQGARLAQHHVYWKEIGGAPMRRSQVLAIGLAVRGGVRKGAAVAAGDEHSANGPSVIHVSINDQKPGVRSVLEGATHNAAPYTKVDHVTYHPPHPAELSAQGDV